jgi:hypothetical protein
MGKKFFVLIALSFVVSACLPAFTTQTANVPTPISEADLQLTAAVFSQQTLNAIPSDTSVPTETPVIVTATNTENPATATETQNPVLLTLTATLGTGTVPTSAIIAGTLPFTGTPSATSNPRTPTATIDPQPLFHGTLPPRLPSAGITILNKAKADAYISLRCETKDGYVTYLEYPVGGTVKVDAPIGRYTYVAWVGGNKMTGSFSLNAGKDLTITLFKDKVTIK